MRKLAVGTLVACAGLVAVESIAEFNSPTPVAPSTTASVAMTAASSDQLMAMSGPLGNQRTQFILIDPKTRAVAVYHIDGDGHMALKSARNATYDLQVLEFNGVEPHPQEIRDQLEQR